MRPIAIMLALMASATAAAAQGRVSTQSLPCAQASALVARSGAVVLGTGPFTYERFVRDSSFCEVAETVEPVYAPTADAAQCPVGYRCRSSDIEINDR
ncbi:MAG TPA: hypothetical protein VIL09_12760 [Microvirga sp.]